MRRTIIECDNCGEEIRAGTETEQAEVPEKVQVTLGLESYDLEMRPFKAKGGKPDLCRKCLLRGLRTAVRTVDDALDPSAGTAKLEMFTVRSGIASEVHMLVNMDAPGAVVAIQLVIQFDPEEIEIVDVLPGERLSAVGIVPSWNVVEVGDQSELRVAAVSMDGRTVPDGDGPIADIVLDVESVPAHLDFVSEGEAVTLLSASATSTYDLEFFPGRIRSVSAEPAVEGEPVAR